MPNTLKITRLPNDFFEFILNNIPEDAVINGRNDLTVVDSNEFHFKTENGANIIKNQQIYPADITIVVDGVTFTGYTTVQPVLNKLVEIRFFSWKEGGGIGTGVNRFNELEDTFDYADNKGKVAVVGQSEQGLVAKTLQELGVPKNIQDLDNVPPIVANKMLVSTTDGTATFWDDLPETPIAPLDSLGFFVYENTAPEQFTNVDSIVLTNNLEGANTNTINAPFQVSRLINRDTNRFDFSQLSVGDTVEVKVNFDVRTTVSGQGITLRSIIGPESPEVAVYDFFREKFTSVGTYQSLNAEFSFAITSDLLKNSVGSGMLARTFDDNLPGGTNQSAFIRVKLYYIRVIRKNLNMFNIGGETKIVNGTNSVVVGTGTTSEPYMINVPSLSNKADLVNGTVPANQLPSYVDDVLEFANLAAFPVTGETGKIYIAIDTNQQYRWSGSTYVSISSGNIATTNDLPEGINNLYFTNPRVLSTTLTDLVDVSGILSVTDTILQGFGKVRKTLSDLATAIGLKQDQLSSGVNIKTINSQTILGSGNLLIPATPPVFSDTTFYTISSTTLNTSGTITIPANTIKDGDVWEVEIVCTRNSTDAGATASLFCSLDVEGGLANGFIRNVSVGTGTLMRSRTTRSLFFKNGNVRRFVNSGTFYTDYTNLQNNNILSFDITQIHTLIYGIQLNTSPGTANIEYVIFKKIN